MDFHHEALSRRSKNITPALQSQPPWRYRPCQARATLPVLEGNKPPTSSSIVLNTLQPWCSVTYLSDSASAKTTEKRRPHRRQIALPSKGEQHHAQQSPPPKPADPVGAQCRLGAQTTFINPISSAWIASYSFTTARRTKQWDNAVKAPVTGHNLR